MAGLLAHLTVALEAVALGAVPIGLVARGPLALEALTLALGPCGLVARLCGVLERGHAELGIAHQRRRGILLNERAEGREVVAVLDARPGLRVEPVEVELAQQRDDRLGPLASLGLRRHVLGDATKHHLDLEARLLHAPQQRGRVRAVVVLAVLGDVAGGGRVGQHRALGLVDAGEAARAAEVAGREGGVDESVGDRVVAAGVEDDDLDALGAIDGELDRVELHHLVERPPTSS